jgi:hypothetical protein
MKYRQIPAWILIVFLVTTGCLNSSRNSLDPIETVINPGPAGPVSHAGTQLWGYFEISVDPDTLEGSVAPSRTAMFTANVVKFLNKNPVFLGLHINKVTPTADYTDIDIDVSITHPFPGFPKFDGYDVRGVFMGNGSGVLDYNSDLLYAVDSSDQCMLDDPDDLDGGGPDGYTRWFNLPEFDPSLSTNPLLGYTPGVYASRNFSGTATLNPYRYFAGDLVKDEDLWTWLGYSTDLEGRFSSGATATRNYYLRFPSSTGLKFGYAVLADWTGPDVHPSNAIEAIACSTTVTEAVYYENPTTYGGDLILDMGVFDWHSEIDDGVMRDYNIIIESTVLDSPYTLTESEMTPTGGTELYSTYHVDIPVDTVESLDGNEYWVIVEYPDYDYQNDFGVPNLAYTDPLAAFFRYDLPILDEAPNESPVCSVVVDPSTPMPVEGWDAGVEAKFDASGSYDPEGDALLYEWDFDGDEIFDEDPDDLYAGDPANPTHVYTADYSGPVNLRVTDLSGFWSMCSVDAEVITWPSKNIPLPEPEEVLDIGVQGSNGDLWLLAPEEMWRYSRDSFYTEGELAYSLPVDFPAEFMDVAPTGYAGISAGAWYKVFSPSGTQTQGSGLDGGPVRDVAGFSSDGTFGDSLAFIFGTTKNPGEPDEYVRHYLHLIQPPDYVYNYDDSWCGYNYDPDSGYEGFDKTFYEWIKAMDTDLDGESVWIIEQPDFYCSNWYKDSFLMRFSGDYFGDGTKGSWNDLRDMGRDMQNRFMVLDWFDDSAIIKVFTGDQYGGEMLGVFGDSESIVGDPLRIDGSDFEGGAVVLHDDTGGASGSFLISVFVPSEMPG